MPPFHRAINRAIARKSQKTKVSTPIALLGFAGGVLQTSDIAVASDTARATYNDNYVKPFSRISGINVDLAFYQSNPGSVSNDGYINFIFIKVPAGAFTVSSGMVNGTSLQAVPFIFKIAIAQVPLLSGAGLPSIYHLVGFLKIPRKHQLMAPGDKITFACQAIGGAGPSYSVNGRTTYMFKV